MRLRSIFAGIGLVAAAFPAASGQIVINEIHYAPRPQTVPEEFVELLNHGGGTVNLEGWYFSEGIDFRFEGRTDLAPGEYIVVAQDPDTIRARYGEIRVVGPYTGRLDNQGEDLALRSADGTLQDFVDYNWSFPWPVVGDVGENYSIELIHPDLDNSVGASWRPSTGSAAPTTMELIRERSTWRYFKGTEEPSEPVTAWRQVGFQDGDWLQGQAAIGYGQTGVVQTELSDMNGGYSTVYMRRTFQVEDPPNVRSLLLEVQLDDGFNAWINGVHVTDENVSDTELPHTGTANRAIEDLSFQSFPLPPPGGYLRAGTNVLAIQFHNASLGGSSDAFLDARLTTGSGGAGPTPGAANLVYSTTSPPQLRNVDHFPIEPVSSDTVAITVKATDVDGLSDIFVEFQPVDPGAYVRLSDPAYETNWVSVPMNDTGFGLDEVAGDDIFTAAIPGSVQVHRRLVRYRITATDRTGLSVTVPYPEDRRRNFAYFVYDGVPDWRGSDYPGVSAQRLYSSSLLESIPVYHLLTQRQDRLNAIHVPYRWGASGQMNPTSGEYRGSEYLWQGTLVYDGKVYDHIRFRARGGVWRYSMGKNMWKFDFNRGDYFEARDDYGRGYRSTWDKLNFSAIIQQGNFRQRGEQGLFEAAGFKLHNLALNPTCLTHFIHFRLIEDADEVGPDQFSGDFQGLYLVLEQLDGRFLDEHRLPNGNLYKMEGGTGELNNQGPDQPSDKSDLNAFLTYKSGGQTASWWRQNLDLPEYYSFRAISLAIHDYDMHAGKNYFFFNNPETGKWSVYNWDIDLTWTTTYNGGGGRGPLNEYVLDPFPEFQLEYRNRVRELRDLLFNPEQTGMILDEVAGVVHYPGQYSFVDADRAMWDRNPILISDYINSTKAGHGKYYESASPRTFAGMVQKLKNYVASRGTNYLDPIARDTAIPSTPAVTSVGDPEHRIGNLRFRTSDFQDPQGAGTFGGMAWRMAEITPAGGPGFDPLHPKRYEIEAVWETGELATFQREFPIPWYVPKVGHRYRVRARMMDNTGRWSHWSAPAEFTAMAPEDPFPQQDHLRVTEIMYHPDGDLDLEFIELQNIGPDWLDLRHTSFVEGIEFSFGSSAVTDLGPGEFVVLVNDEDAFRSVYDTTDMAIAGEYDGRLSNAGERLTLVEGANSVILDFDYFDDWYGETDGGGFSLVIVDPLDPPSTWGDPLSWKVSEDLGGSPGRVDGSGTTTAGRQLPGDANQDSVIDVSDAVALLLILYAGGRELPCTGDLEEPGGNRDLLDLNGDETVDLTDAIHALSYLFTQGTPPKLGTRCVRIEGCPSVCGF